MKKIKLIFRVVTITLMFSFALSPSVISKSIGLIEKEKIETIPDSMSTINPIYVGDMYIEGTGHHGTSIVMARAEQDLRIKIKPGGSDVVLEAKYLLQCPGLLDYGYAKLWVQGTQEKEVETDDYAEGYFYTTVYNCKFGDIISWVLTVIYDDYLFPYPLIDFDGGSGICIIPRNSETSTNLFSTLLERFVDQIPHAFTILKYLSDRLPSNNFVIKGTIICE